MFVFKFVYNWMCDIIFKINWDVITLFYAKNGRRPVLPGTYILFYIESTIMISKWIELYIKFVNMIILIKFIIYYFKLNFLFIFGEFQRLEFGNLKKQ